MTPPVDPNDVLMTGENSFIRLSSDGGKTLTDRFSHWRVLWCPDGAGHALFVHSTLIDGQVRIYSDNQAVARWLQKTIEALLYPQFADTTLPVTPAQFSRAGAPPKPATERSEEHTSELQSQSNLVCRLLLEKKKNRRNLQMTYIDYR